MTKDKIIFYLRRLVKDADERGDASHLTMAHRGIPYDQRGKFEADTAQYREQAQALRLAMECVEKCYAEQRTQSEEK